MGDKSLARQIDAIIFDMGHVFVDFEWEQVTQLFLDRSGLSASQFGEILKKISDLGYEKGHLDTDKLIVHINETMQAHNPAFEALTRDEFETIWNHTFRENEEMSAILSDLRKQIPLFLLSNTNESHWGYLARKHDVGRHFEHLVLSYEIKMIKPDRDIYEHAVQKTGFSADRCLFVDDLPANIEGAAAVGLKTILFKGPADLKVRLRALGLDI